MQRLSVRPVHFALLLWGLVIALMLSGRVELVDRLVLTGPDDYIRLLRVESILAGGDWVNTRIERAGPAPGIPLHWSPIADAPYVLVAQISGLFVDQTAALKIAVTAVPLIGLLAMFLIATWAGGWLFGGAGAWLAPVAVFYADALVGQFVPGRIDHHGLQLLLTTGLVLSCIGIIRSNKVGWAAFSGLVTAVSLAIGLETLPYIAAFHASLGLAWLGQYGVQARSGIVSAGTAVVAAAVLLWLFPPEPQYLWGACDALSGVYLTALATIAVGWIVLAAFSNTFQSVFARTCLGGAVGLGVTGVVAIVFPECLSGPYGSVPQHIRDFWLDDVDETQSALQLAVDNPRRFISLFWIAILALAATIPFVAKGRWRDDPSRIALILFLGLSVIISLWQIRGASFVALFAMLAALPLFVALKTWSEKQFRGWRGGAILALILFILSPPILNSAMVSAGVKTVQNRTTPGCGLPENLAQLAGQPQGLVASSMPLGPMILYFTGHRVLAAPYHRGTDAMDQAISLWSAETENDAWRAAKELGVNYILVCDSQVAYGMRGRAGLGSFVDSLMTTNAPAWLLRLNPDDKGGLRLFRVTSSSDGSSP